MVGTDRKMGARFALIALCGLAAALVACVNPLSPQADGDAAARVAALKDATLVNARVNAILDGKLTDARRAELARYGAIKDEIAAIDAVTVQGKGLTPARLLELPFVVAASFDAERSTGPVQPLPVDSLVDGISTWDQDSIDVTDFGAARTIDYDGEGVFVAVLDTGLVDGWERYFPVERIAVQYGKAFGGGGGENGAVSEPTNKWEHDTNSHGTHVCSSILGYDMNGTRINGAAPLATVIPVKVLNNNGSGWSSMIAAGIVYVADLKQTALGGAPLVINMSLGGSVLDAVEKAAIDYAVDKGVIVVASAGNSGEAGMGYPGAYDPVISVAASGWTGEWQAPVAGQPSWWRRDVADPSAPEDFYITDFSSRELEGQDLDVAAPGSWIVGPYQVNGQQSYYYLGGTSMASPHVAGIVALLCEKKPNLSAAEAEALLESTALPLPAGTRMVRPGSGAAPAPISWGDDASGSGLVDTLAALAALP